MPASAAAEPRAQTVSKTDRADDWTLLHLRVGEASDIASSGLRVSRRGSTGRIFSHTEQMLRNMNGRSRNHWLSVQRWVGLSSFYPLRYRHAHGEPLSDTGERRWRKTGTCCDRQPSRCFDERCSHPLRHAISRGQWQMSRPGSSRHRQLSCVMSSCVICNPQQQADNIDHESHRRH